jgi:hypothetical protein
MVDYSRLGKWNCLAGGHVVEAHILFMGFAEQIGDFRGFGFFESLAALFQCFIELSGRVLQLFVGIGGAADQDEMIGSRQPLVSVGIESDAEQAHNFAFGFAGLAHGVLSQEVMART